MNDEFDRVLSSEPRIDPSPVFVRSVMAAVERESAAPPPIPFPWLRAAPLAATALAFVVLIGYMAVSLRPALAAPASGADALPVLTAAAWITVGLVVSAASITAAMVRIER